MPNTKISALSSGSPLGGSDKIVVARSGANFNLSLDELIPTRYNVKTYGAKGDGATDDTAAIQAAITAAKAVSGVVYLPEGQYKVTSLTVEGCILRGNGALGYTDSAASMLLCTDTVNPAVILKPGGSVVGVSFYHPNQVTTAVPTVYPPTVQCQTDPLYNNAQSRLTEVRECLFVNSYVAIDTNGSSAASAATWIKIVDNRICAISIGIRHPYSLIETFICRNNFTFALWDASQGQPIRTTISANAIAIKLGNGTDEVDGTTIADNGIFGFNKGIYFAGNATITTIIGTWFDGCCFGIDFSGVSTQTGDVIISGCYFGATDPNASTRRGYAVGATWAGAIGASTITLTGCTFGPSHGDQVNFSGASGSFAFITISGCNFNASRSNDTTTASYGVFGSGAALSFTVSGNIFQDQINQSSGKMVGVSLATLVANVNGNSFSWMNKSVDVSGVGFGGHASVNGNVAHNTTTQDLFYPSTADIAIIGTNRWVKGPGGLDESTSGATSVASAATVTLPNSYDFILITGTTGITSIAASWPGRRVTLYFASALTVTDGSNLKLAGNLTTANGTTLTLAYDGSNWYEMSRSVN